MTIIVPDELRGLPPGEVIVIIQDDANGRADTQEWMKAQEAPFARAWDNDEDGVYDTM